MRGFDKWSQKNDLVMSHEEKNQGTSLGRLKLCTDSLQTLFNFPAKNALMGICKSKGPLAAKLQIARTVQLHKLTHRRQLSSSSCAQSCSGVLC